jgi:hypothetical protein
LLAPPFFLKGVFMSDTSKKRDAALRTADGMFQVWQARTQMVKKELAAASAANDAKTARLKALRLEKERQDAEEAAANPAPEPVKKRATAKRINIG